MSPTVLRRLSQRARRRSQAGSSGLVLRAGAGRRTASSARGLRRPEQHERVRSGHHLHLPGSGRCISHGDPSAVHGARHPVSATIEVLARELCDEHGLLSRYREDDGLAGTEGALVFCTFWLAHAQALAGELDGARETFERALHCGNDLGLLSEEFDSAAGEQLGNVPQAFSHIGLVNAAWAISQSEQEGGAQPATTLLVPLS
ncbi:MAG: glycoside hydrolase family 15 protein [Dermatophilaceae bacterium]